MLNKQCMYLAVVCVLMILLGMAFFMHAVISLSAFSGILSLGDTFSWMRFLSVGLMSF